VRLAWALMMTTLENHMHAKTIRMGETPCFRDDTWSCCIFLWKKELLKLKKNLSAWMPQSPSMGSIPLPPFSEGHGWIQDSPAATWLRDRNQPCLSCMYSSDGINWELNLIGPLWLPGFGPIESHEGSSFGLLGTAYQCRDPHRACHALIGSPLISG